MRPEVYENVLSVGCHRGTFFSKFRFFRNEFSLTHRKFANPGSKEAPCTRWQAPRHRFALFLLTLVSFVNPPQDAAAVEGDFGDQDDDTVPARFVCPISKCVMTLPTLVCGSGLTYDYDGISRWVRVDRVALGTYPSHLWFACELEELVSIEGSMAQPPNEC